MKTPTRVWRPRLFVAGRRLLVGLASLVVVGALVVGRGAATTSFASVQVVFENQSYYTHAVDPSGRAYGTPVTNDYEVMRSSDEGRTWTHVYSFPTSSTIYSISALSDGTLLASVDTGTWTIWRSADSGSSWTQVLSLPQAPVAYRTLTPHSIAEGDGYVWLGTYNDGNVATTNYVYRSADDGRTWSVTNTTSTHRHIHGLGFNPADGKLYVFFGDGDGDGVWVSSDDGRTLSPLCTLYACVAIDAAFDPTGTFAIFGQDNYTAQNHVVRLDLTNGASTTLANLPYDSFSTFRLGDVYLVGTTHESGVPVTDPNLHLYASIDGGSTFSEVFQRVMAYTTGTESLQVQFAFPNGDFPIQIEGYGTIVGRLTTVDAPPANVTPPTVSGTLGVGRTLTADPGTWSGSPTSFTYGWQRCDPGADACGDIEGATGKTYRVTADDVGFALRVAVTARNGAGTSQPAYSETTDAVSAPPVNVVAPSVRGSTVIGQILTAEPGTWTGSPAPTYAYDWQWSATSAGDWSSVSGATASTYVVDPGDAGNYLRVEVTATNSEGSATASSAATARVLLPPVNTVPPQVVGAAVLGSTLTVTAGTWTGIPAPTLSDQWQSSATGSGGWTPIAGGAGASFVVTSALAGSYVRVAETATNAAGSAAALSASIQVPAPAGGSGGGGGSSGGGAGAADLRLEGSVEPQQAAVGDTVTWRLTVNDYNTGPAVGAWLDVQLSDNVSITSTYADRGSGCVVVAPGRLHCDLDWLADSAQFAHVIVTTRVTAAGDLVVTANTGYSHADPVPTDNALTLTMSRATPPVTPPVTLPAAPKPRVRIVKTAVAKTGLVVVSVAITGWDVNLKHVKNAAQTSGYWVIYVDGKRNAASRFATKGVTTKLAPGRHTLRVELLHEDGKALRPRVGSNVVVVGVPAKKKKNSH